MELFSFPNTIKSSLLLIRLTLGSQDVHLNKCTYWKKLEKVKHENREGGGSQYAVAYMLYMVLSLTQLSFYWRKKRHT